LDQEAERHAMRKRAYLAGREMVWSQVAHRYMEAFELARSGRRRLIHAGFAVKPLDQRPQELPPLKLDHLRRLTDNVGILQHALFTVPNYHEGYTTDDNARALVVGTLLERLGNKESSDLQRRFLAFLSYAFDPETKTYRNFMSYQRSWLEERGSEDCHGRALRALGNVLGHSVLPGIGGLAGMLFQQSLLTVLEFGSPRAWAFALIGIHEYLQRFAGDSRAHQVQEDLGGRLVRLYRMRRSDSWRWFEDSLTYCNAALPHALLLTGESLGDPEMTSVGLEALGWLADLQHSAIDVRHFAPIGTNGFYTKGGDRAFFDQQPIEAQAMVSAALSAYRITGDDRWRREAHRAFQWFLGSNDLNISAYDPTTGGCRDGLHPDRPNENQGAESTLAFLQALLELRLFEEGTHSPEAATDGQSAYRAAASLRTQSDLVGGELAIPRK
jgi:hypothetical protein